MFPKRGALAGVPSVAPDPDPPAPDELLERRAHADKVREAESIQAEADRLESEQARDDTKIGGLESAFAAALDGLDEREQSRISAELGVLERAKGSRTRKIEALKAESNAAFRESNLLAEAAWNAEQLAADEARRMALEAKLEALRNLAWKYGRALTEFLAEADQALAVAGEGRQYAINELKTSAIRALQNAEVPGF